MRADAARASLDAPVPELVRVPGGVFRMGSEQGRDDERPVHEVALGPFLIARTPLTCAEYAGFLRTARVAAPPWWTHRDFAAPDQPVVGLTWFDAVAFAAWLSEATGERWRLPSEAEWECAARGGLEQAPTAWGERVPEGELPDGPLAGPWRVGRGTPNGFGLCDPGTVVHEWCLDWYAPDHYASAPRHDPPGPAEGVRRASRGGSWRHKVRWSPPSARSSLLPEFRYADYGVRLLQEIE